jgi:tryptophan 2,3-dioxygenase
MGYFGASGAPGDLTYANYLRIGDLLSLQRPHSDPPSHDEIPFILVHQVSELWFRLVLHELDAVAAHLERAHDEDFSEAARLLARAAKVLALVAPGIRILETMRPVDFLAFRDQLKPGSGFQSAQFRELEFLLGFRDESVIPLLREEAATEGRLRRRLAEPSIRERFFAGLYRRGFETDPRHASGEARLAALRRIYEDPMRYPLEYGAAEGLVELDERLGMWRLQHLAMVERVIGGKTGTGASVTGEREGVRYLRTTVGRRAFPELWEVRTLLGGKP